MSGEAVIGVVGRDVPIEVFDAVGARVRRLDALPRGAAGPAFADAFAEAGEILGTGIDPDATATLAHVLADPSGLDAIVLCSDADATQRLYYALRELARREHDRGLPPVHLADVLHLPRASSLAYTAAEVARLQDALGDWTGRRPSAGDVADAARARGQVRRALWLLADLRPAISGADFALLRARADELAPEAALVALREAVASARRSSPADLPRIALTGSSQWGPAVVERIEQCGVRVVADDCAGGALGLELDVREPSVDGIAERAWRDGQSAHRGSALERAASLAVRAERAGAAAIVSYARRRDDAAMWEVGTLRAATALPVVVVHEQAAGDIDLSVLRGGLEQIGMLR
ncbi:hypothetical protein CVS47_03294 [Microbacterium lemovicicum]|uniref:2-hydroxyglutaryl-CoA dehydratase, D-component n=3 Tax=Microbacterium lemovicicum TaxID=1072463 RepID=A0A3S9WF09_9MICO|nr:2-hydroxyacyl-CoA dehydratase family protein [Microbacterium lemovicicum]AZS38635.1 hypothetical protein CVS47_03294 [Microbacterium lemovicicum]